MRSVFACFVGVALLTLAGCATSNPTAKSKLSDHDYRAEILRGTFGTYCRPPHLANGRVDVSRLVAELVDTHANTYSFCIHRNTNDWDDFKSFLPLARKQGIKVWGSIVPPSESPPHAKLYAEPFQLDYERWAVEFAKLSLREPNLVAWSIDDFTHNLKVYTPEHLKKMLDASRQVNPKLAFIPCCYFKAITTNFVQNYGVLLDGMLFPYRDESGGSNLKNPDAVEFEVNKIKELAGKSYPVIFDVYATAHSRLGATTPDYVEKAMISGQRCADGVLVYCHQDPQTDPEKYAIIKMLFGNWSANQKFAPH